MANMLQSSQTQATQAPSFYTDYLSGLATQGKEAQQAAQFVGAQPLQTKAFEKVCQNFGAGQQANLTGQGFLGQAAGQNIVGANTPYLEAATTASPLCAARPLICQSRGLDIGNLAGDYMSPYVRNAVQAMSDIGQRNIRQNLSPAATAAAVGSGQFGSQRGAQVLGQIQSQAQQDLNAQISNMLNTGYGQALQAATAKQGALSNLAQTTAGAQQAQNQANIQAAQAATDAASRQAQSLYQSGIGMGQLGQQAAGMNLACINALATLGGQQQTIGQNEQLFPLTTLSSLAGLLQGYNIPTSTKTTLCMSPLSGVAAVGTGLGGLLQTDKEGKNLLCAITGSKTFGNLACRAFTFLGDAFRNSGSGGLGINIPDSYRPSCSALYGCAAGGSVQSKAEGGAIGCVSMVDGGAIPQGFCAPVCVTCTPYVARGGLIGATGCMSTQYRGALPYKG